MCDVYITTNDISILIVVSLQDGTSSVYNSVLCSNCELFRNKHHCMIRPCGTTHTVPGVDVDFPLDGCTLGVPCHQVWQTLSIDGGQLGW